MRLDFLCGGNSRPQCLTVEWYRSTVVLNIPILVIRVRFVEPQMLFQMIVCCASSGLANVRLYAGVVA